MKREREFLDRIADALADLPAGRRRDLLRDLAAHLDELPPEARAELSPPEQYARELREALDVPERPSRTRRLGRWGIAAAVVLIAGAGIVGYRLHNEGGSGTASSIAVPTLVGTGQDRAVQTLRTAGLHVKINPRESATAWGTVLAAHPDGGRIVAAGSTVVLDIAVPVGGALHPTLEPTARPVLIVRLPDGETLWATVRSGDRSSRSVLVGNPPHPFMTFGTGLCTEIWRDNHGGSGNCMDTRFAPKVTTFGTDFWVGGVTVSAATTVRLHFRSGPDLLGRTVGNSAFPGVRFFLVRVDRRLPFLNGATGLDDHGRVVAQTPPN